jgi:signal transduction histidine kinase
VPLTQSRKECLLAPALAQRLRDSKRDLVLQWLERIVERVTLAAGQVFPTDDLLDNVPLLVDGIADYVENPAEEIGTDAPVVGKAMELGKMRYHQGFDVYQILKEYEMLGDILFGFLVQVADGVTEACEKGDLLVCGQRLFRSIAIIQQTTTTHYLRLADTKVAERENRLRAFNRAMSHEIKTHIGVILGAGDLISIDSLTAEERKRFQQIIVQHARAMKVSVDNLIALARLDGDGGHHRHVRLPEAVKAAFEQVRESARDARVDMRLQELPDVEVNAAALELVLANYLSNAIKYADPSKPEPFVEVSARMDDRAQRLNVRVSDNGLGVPLNKRDRLFRRFFRAHQTVTDAEGTGLGLSIVRETVESLGGEAWAEFPESGSVFVVALPYRSVDDATRPERSAPAPA